MSITLAPVVREYSLVTITKDAAGVLEICLIQFIAEPEKQGSLAVKVLDTLFDHEFDWEDDTYSSMMKSSDRSIKDKMTVALAYLQGVYKEHLSLSKFQNVIRSKSSYAKKQRIQAAVLMTENHD